MMMTTTVVCVCVFMNIWVKKSKRGINRLVWCEDNKQTGVVLEDNKQTGVVLEDNKQTGVVLEDNKQTGVV